MARLAKRKGTSLEQVLATFKERQPKEFPEIKAEIEAAWPNFPGPNDVAPPPQFGTYKMPAGQPFIPGPLDFGSNPEDR